jgi:hypothetical protein
VTGSGGVFVYSGTPGPGNPPIAWMSGASTDPYGNSLPSTTGVAGTGTFSVTNSATGANITMELVGGVPIINFGTAGSDVTVSPFIIVETQNGGAANERQAFALSSGKESGNPDAALQLFSESADGTLAANALFEFGGQTGMFATTAGTTACEPGTSVTPEVWHTVSNPTGVTGTIRVKILTEANAALLQVNCSITSTLASASNYAAGSVPSSAYYPASNLQQPLSVSQPIAASQASPRVGLTTAGAVTLAMPAFVTAGNACTVEGTWMYPLN